MPYASQADLTNVGFNQNVQGALTPTQIAQALQDASDLADAAFTARYGAGSTPLLAWDTTITKAVAQIAAYYLLCIRGYNPNSAADQNFRTNYEDAIAYLGKVQRQQAHPRVTPAGSSANPGAIQPLLISSSVVNLSTGARGSNRGF